MEKYGWVSFVLKKIAGAGETIQWLRTAAALAKNLTLVLSSTYQAS